MTAINSNRAIRGPVTAVPVVAGKGVRLVADTENNRIVAESDETVLYTNSSADPAQITSDTNVTLSESIYNFERVKILYKNSYGAVSHITNYIETLVIASTEFELGVPGSVGGTGAMFDTNSFFFTPTYPARVTVKAAGFRINVLANAQPTKSDSRGIRLLQIIGINRISASA